jgi:hypothetical protein
VTRNEIERRLAEAFPDGFLRGCVQSAFIARRLAWEDARPFAFSEAENLRPVLARAHMEGLLRSVADRHGIDAEVERASNWYHTEIRSGPVILTQNSVSTPCALLDSSNYREILAKDNDQGVLDFFNDGTADEAVRSPFLVLLLHSQNRSIDPEHQRQYGYLAGSAYLAVPAANLKNYKYTLNLFDRFPDVVANHMPQEWDQEARIRFLRRARRVAG